MRSHVEQFQGGCSPACVSERERTACVEAVIVATLQLIAHPVIAIDIPDVDAHASLPYIEHEHEYEYEYERDSVLSLHRKQVSA